MPAPPVGAVKAHAFVDDLDVPVLEPGDRHHLERVLRLVPGDVVTIADGEGSWRPCRFGASLEPAGEVVMDPGPVPLLTVAFAVVKGDRPEWTVQKLTELGVDVIVPMHTDRSVVRWVGERGERHVARLRRVARESAMQARRSRLPLVEPVAPFTAVVNRPGALLAAPGGRSLAPGDALVLVGPEGGWTSAEVAEGKATISLGPTVLRSETAAVAAGVLLAALRPGGALNAKGG